jgi:hypothetical protein
LLGKNTIAASVHRLKRNHPVSINVTEWFLSVNVIGHKFCGQFACHHDQTRLGHGSIDEYVDIN